MSLVRNPSTKFTMGTLLSSTPSIPTDGQAFENISIIANTIAFGPLGSNAYNRNQVFC